MLSLAAVIHPQLPSASVFRIPKTPFSQSTINPSMPTLKLMNSICTRPYKLVRTIASPIKSSSPSPLPTSSSLPFNLHIASNLRRVKKIPSFSPLPPPCLGFPNCKALSSSYSPDKGCENRDDDVDWNRNGGLHKPDEDNDEPKSKLLTLPTLLTIARVAAVPILVNTFYMDSWLGTTATTGIFVFASITDWLDGYLARKMKLSSQFGAFLDPVADKLMVATTLILLCTKPIAFDTFGQIPWLLTVPAIAIIGREITMSAVREWAASQDGKLLEAVAVNNLGKWKTATQMSALTILLASRDSSLVGANGLVATGVVLLYISAWLAIWSLFVYMRKISKVLLK